MFFNSADQGTSADQGVWGSVGLRISSQRLFFIPEARIGKVVIGNYAGF